MSPADFYLVLAFGFVSSLHCVQMCGPLVLTYSVPSTPRNTPPVAWAAFGPTTREEPSRIPCLAPPPASLAGTMRFVGRLAGFEGVAAIVAGIAMLLTGLVLLNVAHFKGWRGLQMPSQLLKPAGRLMSSSSASASSCWACDGFLPCGLIYAALMKALGEPHR